MNGEKTEKHAGRADSSKAGCSPSKLQIPGGNIKASKFQSNWINNEHKRAVTVVVLVCIGIVLDCKVGHLATDVQ